MIKLAEILKEMYYTRDEMPQVEDIPSAVKRLKEMGVKIRKERCTPSLMKHVQVDYDPEKVNEMADSITPDDVKPIILSIDDYIVDGNHRKLALEKGGYGNVKISIYRIYLNCNMAIQKYNDVAMGGNIDV